ncbi:MAG: hypothetical protein L6R38_006124 [Xanthoria sp. 2 TBL-2021]|nr:MAG: hypothetical protein L6R38_006124 [Xanthoria sp. 2 TBL-2021]
MAPPFDNEEVKAPLFNDEEVNYIVSLKSFYSDIDFTSLTQTFNFWYDHCIEPIVIEWFCRAFIGTSRVPVDTPPKLWIKGNLQHGGLNSQLRTLARFRIMHDLVHAMQEDSIPERFRSLYGIRQSPNVNRLELSSMYRYEDLRGLSPVDLMRVYIAREKQEEDDWKFMKKQLENLHVKIEAHLDQKDPKERKRHCDMLKAGFEKTYQKEQ